MNSCFEVEPEKLQKDPYSSISINTSGNMGNSSIANNATSTTKFGFLDKKSFDSANMMASNKPELSLFPSKSKKTLNAY